MQSLLNFRKIGAAFVAAITLLLVGLAPGTANAHDDGDSETPEVRELIEDLKDATDDLTNVKDAEAAGYHAEGGCVEKPGVGAMGVHYVNQDLVDGVIDPEAPEVLVFMPDGKGNYTLGAVEFLTVGLTEAPVIAGIQFDNGPGPDNHSLHAWIYVENPKGTFVNYNPTISCP